VRDHTNKPVVTFDHGQDVMIGPAGMIECDADRNVGAQRRRSQLHQRFKTGVRACLNQFADL